MKHLKKIKEICYMENDTIYTINDGLDIRESAVFVRDVTINAGISEEICIGFIADTHLNFCNRQDFNEAEPVIMSTYEHRSWGANGYHAYRLRNVLSVLDDVDQIVIGGDTLDYLSHGCMDLMNKEVWEKVPGVVAVLGGHETLRKMEGKVDDNLTRKERLAILEKYWRHDIYYFSKLIKNKILVIALFNDLAKYNEEQKIKLDADIKLARKNGYTILIFQHEPIATRNPAHEAVNREDMLWVGDTGSFPYDFYCGKTIDGIMVGNDECTKVTNEVYSLITNNADVIRGIFVGHFHQDMHLDIAAKFPDGKEAAIPQFVVNAVAYDDGHLMRILVK